MIAAAAKFIQVKQHKVSLMHFSKVITFSYWQMTSRLEYRNDCCWNSEVFVNVCIVVHCGRKAGRRCSRVASVECWSWHRCSALLRWSTTSASANSSSVCRGIDVGGPPSWDQQWQFYLVNLFPAKRCFIRQLLAISIRVCFVTLDVISRNCLLLVLLLGADSFCHTRWPVVGKSWKCCRSWHLSGKCQEIDQKSGKHACRVVVKRPTSTVRWDAFPVVNVFEF